MSKHKGYQFEVTKTLTSNVGVTPKTFDWDWVLTSPNGKKLATNFTPFKRKNDLTRTLAVLKKRFNDAAVFEARIL